MLSKGGEGFPDVCEATQAGLPGAEGGPLDTCARSLMRGGGEATGVDGLDGKLLFEAWASPVEYI